MFPWFLYLNFGLTVVYIGYSSHNLSDSVSNGSRVKDVSSGFTSPFTSFSPATFKILYVPLGVSSKSCKVKTP